MEAVGLVGSVINIIDVAGKIIKALQALQQRWSAANMTVNSLVTQLAILETALDEIRKWILLSHQDHLPVAKLELSLECCKTLITHMDDYISQLDWNEPNSLTVYSKVKAVMNDNSVKECVGHLNTQSVALNLLLAASQCRSTAEQKSLLDQKLSTEIFQQIKENSSSLICLRDAASFSHSSFWSKSDPDGSSIISRVFDFDAEIQTSGVYRGHMRALIRRAMRKDPKSLQRQVSPLGKQAVIPIAKSSDTLGSSQRLFGPQGKLWEPESGPKPWEESDDTTIVPHRTPVNDELIEERSPSPRPIWTGVSVWGLDRSGVNTLMEQIGLDEAVQQCYDDSERESDLERETWREFIVSDVVKAVREFSISEEMDLEPELNQALQKLFAGPDQMIGFELTSLVAAGVRDMWHRESQSRRHTEHDAWDDYYFDSIERITSLNYSPTDRDIAYGFKKMHGKHRAIDVPLRFEYRSPAALDHMNRLMPSRYEDGRQDTLISLLMYDISRYDDENGNGLSSILDDLKSKFKSLGNWDIPPIVILLFDKASLFRAKIRNTSDAFRAGSDDSVTMAKTYILTKVLELHQNKDQPLYVGFIDTKHNERISQLIRETMLADRRKYARLPYPSTSVQMGIEEHVEDWLEPISDSRVTSPPRFSEINEELQSLEQYRRANGITTRYVIL